MNFVRFLGVLIVLVNGCKSKPQPPETSADQFFPITDYIKGEVARLDTAKASFFLVETVNGVSDTTAIQNKDVRRYAADLLSLPDITTDKLRPDYKVDQLYDDAIEGFAFVYTTKEDHPVQREDVLLQPDPKDAAKNTIRSIFVIKQENNGNIAVNKKLLWEAGHGFQVTTETDGDPASVKRTKVYWNGFDSTSAR